MVVAIGKDSPAMLAHSIAGPDRWLEYQPSDKMLEQIRWYRSKQGTKYVQTNISHRQSRSIKRQHEALHLAFGRYFLYQYKLTIADVDRCRQSKMIRVPDQQHRQQSKPNVAAPGLCAAKPRRWAHGTMSCCEASVHV